MIESAIDSTSIELSIIKIFVNSKISNRSNFLQFVGNWTSFFLMLLGGIVLMFLIDQKNIEIIDSILGIGICLIALGILIYIGLTVYNVINVNLVVKKIFENKIYSVYLSLLREHSECEVYGKKDNEFLFLNQNKFFSVRIFNDKNYIDLNYCNKKEIAVLNNKSILNHKYHFSWVFFRNRSSTFYQTLVLRIVKFISKTFLEDLQEIKKYYNIVSK